MSIIILINGYTMIKTRKLLKYEKQRVISLHQAVLGYKKIKGKTGFNVSTIRNVIRKSLSTGTVSNKPRIGSTKVKTLYADWLIVRHMITDWRLLALKIYTNLRTSHRVNICKISVRRRIKYKEYDCPVAHK